MCESVDSFSTDTGHLNDNQWSFRRDRSTEELLIYLAETRKAALDKRKVVGVVDTDFQKAFDTVSLGILIYKLQAMGFSGDLLQWMVSYLEDRTQFAEANGCFSRQTKPVTCGVPQGPLLDPRLFTYYNNDLSNSITECNLELYADDTTLHFIGIIVDVVQFPLRGLTRWCRDNKLTIQAGRSEAIFHNP